MKRICTLIVLLFSILLINNKSYSQDDFPVLEGPYLGQKPPSLTAEVFAPGIVQTKCFESFGVFTPDMKEFYFVTGCDAKSDRLVVFKSQNNRWSKSVVGPKVGEPFISVLTN